MLDQFLSAASDVGVARRTIHGTWPEVAAYTPAADLVVCHHVAYDIGDIVPFLWALTDHPRLAVVLEIPTVHPMSAWAPAWQHFWGVERPAGPTSDDLVAVLHEMGLDPEHTTTAQTGCRRSNSRRRCRWLVDACACRPNVMQNSPGGSPSILLCGWRRWRRSGGPVRPRHSTDVARPVRRRARSADRVPCRSSEQPDQRGGDDDDAPLRCALRRFEGEHAERREGAEIPGAHDGTDPLGRVAREQPSDANDPITLATRVLIHVHPYWLMRSRVAAPEPDSDQEHHCRHARDQSPTRHLGRRQAGDDRHRDVEQRLPGMTGIEQSAGLVGEGGVVVRPPRIPVTPSCQRSEPRNVTRRQADQDAADDVHEQRRTGTYPIAARSVRRHSNGRRRRGRLRRRRGCTNASGHSHPILTLFWCTQGMQVLLAEDDRAVRESLVRALQLEGYEVFAVTNGALALDALREHTPDLVLLDVSMPHVDGLTVCRVLHAEGSRLPGVDADRPHRNE